jgi:hypothetical protein
MRQATAPLKTNTLSPEAREIASLCILLGSDKQTERVAAWHDVEKFPQETFLTALLELWTDSQKTYRLTEGITNGALIVGGILWASITGAIFLSNAELFAHWWGALLLLLFGLLMIRWRPGSFAEKRKGMLLALMRYDDIRLTGALIDALPEGDNVPKGVDPRRLRLMGRITYFLPRLKTADVAPLNTYQHDILIAELRRAARRINKGPALHKNQNQNDNQFLSDDEAALVRTILIYFQALPSFSGNRKLRRAVQEVAYSTVLDSQDAANARYVQQAAQESLKSFLIK